VDAVLNILDFTTGLMSKYEIRDSAISPEPMTKIFFVDII